MFQRLDKLMQDPPCPERRASWPQDRHLKDYLRLLVTPWTLKALSEEPKLPEVIALLSLAYAAKKPNAVSQPGQFLQKANPENKPIVVDIGLGDAHALREIKELQDFMTVGIGVHEINPDNQNHLDLLCYSKVPNGPSARRVFDELRGKVALVFDVFGAGTYADKESNPIQALIFIGMLLAEGATAKIIVSSVPKEDVEQSPLGFAVHRQRLIQFFREVLGLDLIISRTYIKSLVMEGSYSIDFNIEIKRRPNAVVSELPLDELFLKAEQFIGKCAILPKSTSVGEFGLFGIKGRTYTRIDEKVQMQSIDLTAQIKSSSFHHDDKPIIDLSFYSEMALNDFIIRFSEYYIMPNLNSEWTLTRVDNESISLSYNGSQDDHDLSKQQALIELSCVCPDLFRNESSVSPKV